LLAVAGDRGGVGGLPPWGALLEIEPADTVRLTALKAAGNPLASGSGRPVNPADAVAIRLVETHGWPTDVVIRTGLQTVAAPSPADLLERPLGPKALTLHGYEIATVLTRLNGPQVIEADHTPLAADAETAQPLYARYWLHNRGPAPLGGLPVVAHLHPRTIAAEPDDAVRVRLTVASSCTDAVLHGKLRFACPPDWTADPAQLPFFLPPGEHLDTDVELTIPANTAAGVYPIRAGLVVTGSSAGAMPASWRQHVEDTCTVHIGNTDGEILRLVKGPENVELGAGESAWLAVTVGTDARTELSIEAHLISPWGTWEWLGPNVIGAVLPAGGTVELRFSVTPPDWVEPGEWWALVRIASAGQPVYSPAVRVVVR
jgi:alpha-mannosidase